MNYLKNIIPFFFNKIIVFFSLILVFTTKNYAQNLPILALPIDRIEKDSTENKQQLLIGTDADSIFRSNVLQYPPPRDTRRLLNATGIYFGTAIATMGVLWLLPESFTKWDKDEIKSEGFFNQWSRNVKRGPVWDKDGFGMNYIAHPYVGGIYYMTARSSGFKAWESGVYSALMSTFFWEYGVEAFAEIPSKQDLIITPIAGSIIGEVFFRSKKRILSNNRMLMQSKFLGTTALALMDPFNELLDWMGYTSKYNANVQSAIAPVGYNYFNKQHIWGIQATINF